MSPSLYTFSPKWGFNVTRSASAGNISESYRCSADNGKELQVNVEYTVPPSKLSVCIIINVGAC